jgi:hypothetical protein
MLVLAIWSPADLACFTGTAVFYGIASSLSADIDDFYASVEEAEAVLARICADEPELERALWVEQVEFELSAN